MGCQSKEPEDVVILEGKIAGLEKSDRLSTHIRFQTGDGPWMPGSAGFDEFGAFSFVVTNPRRFQRREALADTAQNTIIDAFSSIKHLKQWASCIQVVKDWVEPLWRIKKDEVFQGLAAAEDDAKRASLQEKSVKLRSCVVSSEPATTPVHQQATLQGRKNAESHPTKPGNVPASPPSKKPAEKWKSTTKTVAVETTQEPPRSEFEKYSPKNARATPRIPKKKPLDEAAMREQRAKHGAFTALKQNKGLNRLKDKATRTTEQETDSVSVQTELFVTDADVKPMIVVSRPESPEGESGGRRKGQRERWSLPADGHGLDFMRAEEMETLSPPTNRWVPVSTPPTGRYVGRSVSLKEPDNTPSWMDKYYARGRSLSEHPSRSSSAGTTPPRPRRQVVSDAEADLNDQDDITSVSGSSARSLQHSGSAYFKPTISYMQKRNHNQRDSILARQASQTALPRWS